MQRALLLFALLALALAQDDAASRNRRSSRNNRGRKGRRCRLPGCLRCSQNDKNTCELCRIGFGLTPEGQCQPCGPNCKECINAGPGGCDTCKPAFTLERGPGRDTGTTCEACAAHCLQCDEAGPGGCNECGPRRMLHARLELHGEVHECLPCEHGCRTCSAEHGCTECDSFYALLPDGSGCTFSWWRLLTVVLIVLVPACGCGYLACVDDDVVDTAASRRAAAQKRAADNAEVVRDGAAVRRRAASVTAQPDDQAEVVSPRRARPEGAYPLMPGYSGIEITDEPPSKPRDE